MKKGLWTLVASVGLFVLFFTMGCNTGGEKNKNSRTAGPKTDTVLIQAMQFHPKDITVNPGDTVLWINKGIVAHNVTDSTKAWTSGDIPPDSSWRMVPKNDFHYLCTIHPTMTGTVTIAGKPQE